MRPVLAIALKDLKLLLRDRVATFFTFVFPLLVALFFGFVFGSPTRQPLKVGVWNGSSGPAAAAFVEAIRRDGSFEVVPAATPEEGEQQVRKRVTAGFVAIPADFDQRADQMLTGNGPTLELTTDPTRNAEVGLLEGKLYQLAFQTMFTRMGDPKQMQPMIDQAVKAMESANLPMAEQLTMRTALGTVKRWMQQQQDAADRKAKDAAAAAGDGAVAGDGASAAAAPNPLEGWSPVRIESHTIEVRRSGPANMFAVSFLQGLAWALFGAVLSFSSSMADEQERGTLLRLMASPLRPIQVLLGKAGACFVTCAACELMLVGIGTAWFGLVVTSWPFLLLATAITSFAFTGVMMALASVFRTQSGAQGAARAILLVLAMIGGGTIPLMFMPPIVQTASGISPFKWAVMAAEGATWRGWALEDMLLPLGVLAAIGTVGAVVSVVFSGRRG